MIFRFIFVCEISYESVYCNCDSNRKWFILIDLPFLMVRSRRARLYGGEDKGGVRDKINTER